MGSHGAMGSHWWNPWDPMGVAHGIPGWALGDPLALGDTWARGEPLTLGNPVALGHPLALGDPDPWGPKPLGLKPKPSRVFSPRIFGLKSSARHYDDSYSKIY